MIDIKFLREDPDAVRENMKKKFQDHKLPLVDEVLALDKETGRSRARWKPSALTGTVFPRRSAA